MTFEEMFERAKTALMKAKVSDAATVAVQVNVTGDGSGIFYVKADSGVLAVEPYNYKDNDVIITADSAVLLEALEKGKASELPIEGCPIKGDELKEILASVSAKRATRTHKTTTTKTTSKSATKSAAAKTTTSKTAATKSTAATKKADVPKTTTSKRGRPSKKTAATEE